MRNQTGLEHLKKNSESQRTLMQPEELTPSDQPQQDLMQEDQALDPLPPTITADKERLLMTLHKNNLCNWQKAQELNPNNTRAVTPYPSLWKNSHNSLTILLGKEEVLKRSLGWNPYTEETKLRARTNSRFIGKNPIQAQKTNLPEEPSQSTSSSGPSQTNHQKKQAQLYEKPAHVEEESNNMQQMLAFSRAYYQAVKGINKSQNKKKGKMSAKFNKNHQQPPPEA
ncbi:uncharacterized protein MELLADRAFT_66997 [Melampsora larici-populina 98AG31]|uniref:Uncharacterized protein n=1 Tax=Melampsora larici-populina (strain 98AG31 / pathotype 3-4-7) TaxID=747676 RepID=F4S1F2_MELLP|nr:uncharacterized protein MELLADRAFT_66997 [Melampsora larici-populina 98AG31]EGG01554.1 hypothetical protein MELLADRAFT_66997 [Melampsora larici-populina 98AG31]